MKKILFVIGSTRRHSFNRQLANRAKVLLEGSAEVEELQFDDVPFVNQDLEVPAPAAVARVRQSVVEADALWIFSPEYNLSYPGYLKNLIDWLSRPSDPTDRKSPSVLRGKKVTVAGAGGGYATRKMQDKLTELLSFVGMDVMAGPTTGVIVGAKAWTTDELELSASDQEALKAQAEALLSFVGGSH